MRAPPPPGPPPRPPVRLTRAHRPNRVRTCRPETCSEGGTWGVAGNTCPGRCWRGGDSADRPLRRSSAREGKGAPRRDLPAARAGWASCGDAARGEALRRRGHQSRGAHVTSGIPTGVPICDISKSGTSGLRSPRVTSSVTGAGRMSPPVSARRCHLPEPHVPSPVLEPQV